MTTKELLALVGKWREMAGRHRECGPNGAMLAEIRERCADELAPIAAALCAEVEALRKDAERYRWLRDNHSQSKDGDYMNPALVKVAFYHHASGVIGPGPSLDAAIDAARSRNEHEG